MDEVAQVAEAVQQFDRPPIGDSPKEPSAMRKIFNASSWFVFFAFLPITVLILLSQNTIPGDFFYPIKRGMENVVLAAATVSPATRVAFRTDLTERRFDEAEKLLLARSDTTGLSDFVQEVQTAQQEVSTLSNLASKKELTEKLIEKIDEYQNKLAQVKTRTEANTPIPSPSQLEPTESKTSVIQKVTPTSSQQIISPKPTSITTSIVPTAQLIPTQTQPTEVQIEPTIEPTITGNPPNDANGDVESAIDDAQKILDKIKDRLKKEQHGGRDKKRGDDKGDEKTNVTDQNQEDKKEKSGSKKE